MTYSTGTPITAIKEEKSSAFTKKKFTACMIWLLKVIWLLYSHKKAFFGKNLHTLIELLNAKLKNVSNIYLALKKR